MAEATSFVERERRELADSAQSRAQESERIGRFLQASRIAVIEGLVRACILEDELLAL